MDKAPELPAQKEVFPSALLLPCILVATFSCEMTLSRDGGVLFKFFSHGSKRVPKNKKPAKVKSSPKNPSRAKRNILDDFSHQKIKEERDHDVQ